MKKIFTLSVLILTVTFLFGQKGYINPAANYAKYMGYKYEISIDANGNQTGICLLPDGNRVNAWDFYKGKVASDFQYGAKFGYETESEVIQHDGYVEERAICIANVKGETIQIPMLELMKMNGDPLVNYESNESMDIHSDAKVDPDFKSTKSLPSSFDWRNVDGHTYIGGVKSQGSCGSCYAFGAAAAAEGTYNYATGNYDGNCADFSEAYIAWCLSTMPAYSSHFSGCNGADYDYQELQALVDVGIVDESVFPYVDADNQSCPSATTSAPKTQFLSWNRVTCADVDAIKTAIMTYGVVDAAVYVSTTFSNYSGGVFSDNYTTCSSNPCYNTTTNHAIALVGWGYDSQDGDYWILRNSWGTSWGEDGYMKLSVHSAHIDCSVCYMKYQDDGTTAPTVSTNNVTSIGDNTATCGGNITNDGGATIISSGIVYSKNSDPTTTNATVLETSPTTTNGSYSVSMSGLLAGTTYYTKAYATNAKGTSYGDQKTFTTTGTTPIEYCTSQGNNYSYEWIAGVVVGSLNNNSGAAGYTDYTSQTVNLTAGQSYDISLTPGFTSTTYNEYWKIWIDYNADGDFDDANELAFDAGSVSKSTVTGTLTVATGIETVTRMRVSMKYDGAQTACESFSYGEVEDYTVNISGGSVDTQAPTTPSNLSTSNITLTTVDLSWTASTDNVGVTAYEIFQGTSSLGEVTGTTASITGLTAATTYTFSVKAKDAAGNVSAASNTVNVTTLSDVDTEAPTIPSNLSTSNITKTTVDLSWTASTDNVGVTAYEIFQGASSIGEVTGTTANITGLTAATTYTFSVKAKDAAGNVSAASNTVNITTLSDVDTEAPTIPSNLSASSITKTSIYLSWNAASDNVGVTGYDVYQNSSKITSVTGTSYSVSGLTANTSYSFYVKAYDAAGNVSAASSSINATTLSDEITYCTSQGNNSSYEWIAEVILGSFTNTSGAAGYTDYTSQTVTVPAGNTSVSLTPGFSGSTYNEYWKIWIDLNIDGDFDDANELVFDCGLLSKTTVTGTMVIPSGSEGVVTRMRVSMKYDGAQTACESFSYGEVEDYTVNISGTAANVAPIAEANGSYSAIEGNAISFSSTGSTDSDGTIVSYNWNFGDGYTSSSANPTHTYTTAGNYTATLTVTDDDGATDSDNASVTITSSSSGGDPVVLITEGFEGGFGMWTDGGSDCSLYTSGTRAYEGSNAANIQDNSGIYSSFYLTNGIDVSSPGYTKISVEFYFYAYSMETNEDFWVQYYDGSAWQTVAAYSQGTSFNNVTFYTATVDIYESEYTFPTDMKIRFMCDASGNADDVYIDNITITASFDAAPMNNMGSKDLLAVSYLRQFDIESEENEFDEDDMLIYPNPAQDIINVIFSSDDNTNIIIYNAYGAVVKQVNNNTDKHEINISDIPQGIYFITCTNGDQVQTKRFIKK